MRAWGRVWYHEEDMIRAVLFDVYGTIAGWSPSRYQLQKRAWAQFGQADAITPEGVLRGYANADAFMTAENTVRPIRERDQRDRETFFGEYERLVLEGCGITTTQEHALAVFKRLQQISYGLHPFDDAAPALAVLQRRGLTLGLISNIDQRGDELIDSLGLGDCVDFAVTSGETGLQKPDPAVFRAALRKANAAPNEAIMVGDQPESDIVGAIRVGITPILIDRDGNHPRYDVCTRITSLDQLPPLIE